MLCPKCHQPLDEGDEVYVCCADASVQWRCAQCAKVSEGFAFPYGRCPQCGGALEALAPREIGDDAALAGIRKAFEIELGGKAFYERAAEECEEPFLRQLFGRFASMEQEHMDTLARRYHTAVTAATRAFDVELAAIHAGVERRPGDPANLFRIAITLEQRASAFFRSCAEKAAKGSVERQVYAELAAEEQDHAHLLATELARWQADKGGLMGRGAAA